ncbi:hypothetical protein GK047_03065 [Paenibacillus sp. SYP-B3998]|uniref:ATP-grasp domain-containing protein n=1 Tax=Paenibacillus sp. SYP-B3998 TaxID=2678564 RepID=A0A6G3ZTT2_9BACL|nr:hypothetical protein [Paenibacillus sp. SYP-B3998]NEW04999.1 hypothetical protein [Paenibacillus sp. SYP-B3998]
MQVTNIHNRLIKEKAQEMGIICEPLIPGLEDILLLDNGIKRIYINKTRSNKLPFISGFLSTNKVATNILLRDAGLPIPHFCLVQAYSVEAESFLRQHAPLVVKPFNTNRGVGIVMNIRDPLELQAAIEHALSFSSHVILQEQAEGRDYRILVIDKTVVGVLETCPPSVTGDGVSTIQELIERANQDPRRGTKDQNTPLMHIPIDQPLILHLQSLQLQLSSILPLGELVQVRLNSNDFTGGANIDRTDEICMENIDIAIKAADLLGIDVAGIDLRCPHISQPVSITGGGIIEVNVLPGMDSHVLPSEGKSRDVIGAYLRYLFQ